jgi:hypothetical protein
MPVREILQATYTIRRSLLCREACIFALYLFIFLGVCFAIYDVHKAFQTNDALVDLFLDEEFPGAQYKKNFFDVMTFEETWQWMQGPMLSGAYPNEWYNGDQFTPQEQGMVLYSAHLIGGVQLRQIRVRAGTCVVTPSFSDVADSSNCYGEFTFANQATEPFGALGWGFSTGHHWLSGLNGYGADYGYGGYVTQLPSNRTEAIATLASLEANRWIDRGTRAVMVMMNFFNPQTDLVTVVRVLFEIFPSGHIVKSYKFYSFQVGLYAGVLSYGRAALEAVLVLGVLYYLGRELREMYLAPSVCHYMSSLGNAFEVTLQLLMLTFILYWVQFLLSPRRTSFGSASGTFTDVFAVAEQYVYVFTIAGFIGLLLTLKLFRFFSVSQQMQALFNTMMKAAPDLGAFLFGFVVLVAGFSFSGVMLWGSLVAEFHNLPSAFSTLLRLSLGDFDYAKLNAAQPVVTGYFFAFYVAIVYLVAMNILIAIVTMYFEEVTRLLKQDEAWKQALPGMDAEFVTMAIEGCRPCCRACCGCCSKAKASSASSRGVVSSSSGIEMASVKGPEPPREATTRTPRAMLQRQEQAFKTQLLKIMRIVELRRGRNLEEFVKDIYLSRKPGQQLFLGADELRKLCSSPGGTQSDGNALRRCLACILPCCCSGPVNIQGMASISPRGSAGDHVGAVVEDDVDKLFQLYLAMKKVTLVGRVHKHTYAFDTFEAVEEEHDWDLFQDTPQIAPVSEGAAPGDSHRDRSGRPWYVVKKVNRRGVLQTRQVVLHRDKDDLLSSCLLNYNRQGFLHKRLLLSDLGQIELSSKDPRILGLLFVASAESKKGELSSFILESRDTHFLLVFHTAEDRTKFLDDLNPILRAIVELDNAASSTTAKPAPAPEPAPEPEVTKKASLSSSLLSAAKMQRKASNAAAAIAASTELPPPPPADD